jgi:hypothetical protein
MTQQQHQIERMRAWVAFATVPHEQDPIKFADTMLKLFDERFPSGVSMNVESDTNAAAHLSFSHRKGSPMPCGFNAKVRVMLSDGSFGVGEAKFYDWSGFTEDYVIEWEYAE